MRTAAELRAFADEVEKLEGLDDAAAKAKAAYQANLDDPEAKAAHRKASQNLNDAREKLRGAQFVTASNEPGSTTVVASGVKGA